MKRRALWITEPGKAEVREDTIQPPAPDEVSVQVILSALSAGTERLFFEGRVPLESKVDSTLPGLDGKLEYPLKYGYSAVGVVQDVGSNVDPDWIGQRVFAFRPHESHFTCPPEQLVRLPDALRAEDAVFLANLETAVNLLLDGAPLIGERVVVHGQGVVGLLTTALLAELPLELLIAVEPAAKRRQAATAVGADEAVDPDEAGALERFDPLINGPASAADLSYELSGAPQALDLAVATTGYSGRVVLGAWYGEEPVRLHLGERFHRSRIRLISSQVSTLDPIHQGRWSKSRRIGVALAAAQRLRPSMLITHRVGIQRADHAYSLLDQPDEAIQVVISYEGDEAT